MGITSRIRGAHSSAEGGKDANVFVYEGVENDPAEDNPIVFVVPETLIDGLDHPGRF